MPWSNFILHNFRFPLIELCINMLFAFERFHLLLAEALYNPGSEKCCKKKAFILLTAEINAEARDARTCATAVGKQKSESPPILLWWRSKGVRRPVSLLFLLSGTQAACHARRQLPCCTPPNPPPLLPLPPSISLECYLSHDYTWDPLASLSLNQLLTPSPYPADFVFCPHINAEQSAE